MLHVSSVGLASCCLALVWVGDSDGAGAGAGAGSGFALSFLLLWLGGDEVPSRRRRDHPAG